MKKGHLSLGTIMVSSNAMVFLLRNEEYRRDLFLTGKSRKATTRQGGLMKGKESVHYNNFF